MERRVDLAVVALMSCVLSLSGCGQERSGGETAEGEGTEDRLILPQVPDSAQDISFLGEPL